MFNTRWEVLTVPSSQLKNLENTTTTARTYQGVIVADVTGLILSVNVRGNVIPALWDDPLIVNVGDPVLVMIANGCAYIIGRLNASGRPGTGTVTVVPVGSQTITVVGADGVTYTASFLASYTPAVNDVVTFGWYASSPVVFGKSGTIAVPPPPPPPPVAVPVAPPPAPPQTGSTTYAATDSGTYTPGLGGWDEWAGGGGQVYQGGSAYGYANNGAWFYRNSFNWLGTRTITAVKFHTGQRLTVGSYNSPVTFHFYAHTSATKPGGDVTRLAGPYDVSIHPNQGPTTITLPTTWGSIITAGGGISIVGEPYGGMAGRRTQPDSGKLTLNWSR